MKWLLIILMAVPLASCVTSQERSQPMALAPDATTTSQCVRYGFPEDAPAFGDCNTTPDKP
jgi:hypothetical protein